MDRQGNGGIDNPCGLKVDLTGNLEGQFEGRHIRFSVEHPEQHAVISVTASQG